LCSPTRAALLTGRNHHSAATGCITELGSSFPGYTGQVPKSCAMVSEIVRQNGYSTAFFGKNHNIADWETSISGPFDRWPNMQGFDHFYGFVGGEANQWQPALYDAVLRDVRQPGGLRQRLDRHVPARPAAVGERRLLRLRQGRVAALQPGRRFQRSQRP